MEGSNTAGSVSRSCFFSQYFRKDLFEICSFYVDDCIVIHQFNSIRLTPISRNTWHTLSSKAVPPTEECMPTTSTHLRREYGAFAQRCFSLFVIGCKCFSFTFFRTASYFLKYPKRSSISLDIAEIFKPILVSVLKSNLLTFHNTLQFHEKQKYCTTYQTAC